MTPILAGLSCLTKKQKQRTQGTAVPATGQDKSSGTHPPTLPQGQESPGWEQIESISVKESRFTEGSWRLGGVSMFTLGTPSSDTSLQLFKTRAIRGTA